MSTSQFSELKNVLITDDVNEKCIEILQNNNLNVCKNTKLTKTELLEEIKKYDCLIVRSATKVTEDVLRAGCVANGGNLKLVGRAGTGVDNVDVPVASELGVLVMNTPGSNTISATELTCAHILAIARHLPQAYQSMKEGKWERSKLTGTELFGKTLALIGLGRVGKEVGVRMRAFGMNVVGYDPIVTAQQAAEFNIEFKSLEEIWPVADFISIHVPLLPETENLLNADVMAKCKRGFRLVNCARGGIVNEQDLLAAVQSGQCAAAGLDVFVDEPTKNFDLVKHPNIICTPHLGASSYEAQNRVAIDIAEQIVKLVKNNVLEGGVNQRQLKN